MRFLNELDFPLARAIEPRAGELQQLTPATEALYVPDIDASLWLPWRLNPDSLWTRNNHYLRLVGLLVKQVTYDGATGKVAITFHPTSIRALADELSLKQREMSA